MARGAGCLHVDSLLESLTPEQFDELEAADRVDPSGELRDDLRFCWLLRLLIIINGTKADDAPSLKSLYAWWKSDLAEYLGPV